jgi:hypothetical protein
VFVEGDIRDRALLDNLLAQHHVNVITASGKQSGEQCFGDVVCLIKPGAQLSVDFSLSDSDLGMFARVIQRRHAMDCADG